VAVTRIDEFMESIGARGGMSLTTQYEVSFDFTGKSLTPVTDFYTDESFVNMLCDEAQLPNVQSGVAQITGRYLGEGPISYPHTRIFTDLSLGFQLDAEATPLKFLTAWYDYIFSEDLAVDPQGRKLTNRVNRLRYMDDYTCNCKIVKTEMPVTNRPFGETIIGSSGILSADSATDTPRKSMTYILENCYPYSIDSVPLSYGSSQITRATANFYYTRHHVVYEN
jgi:hypothetical protein|tara:strand:+ start:3198 stop:3869 length:672 start_codon:yes stop_codon:yes gene_type:complete